MSITDVRVQVPPRPPCFLKEVLNCIYGRVVELVDSLDSGSSVHYGRAGSSPASPTKEIVERLSLFYLPILGKNCAYLLKTWLFRRIGIIIYLQKSARRNHICSDILNLRVKILFFDLQEFSGFLPGDFYVSKHLVLQVYIHGTYGIEMPPRIR